MIRKLSAAVVLVGLLTSQSMAGVMLFNDQMTFENFNILQGNSLDGIEDFSESNVTSVAQLVSPLLPGVPNLDPFNNQGFPTGLAQPNISIASFDPVAGVHVGFLVALGANLAGPGLPSSVVVGPDIFDLSTDLLFGPGADHTAIGFQIIDLSGAGNGLADIQVYDKNGVLMSTILDWPSPSGSMAFFGVWSDEPIGRINVAGQAGGGGTPGGELVGNIQMWVPEPASLTLLAFGALVMARRRR